MRSLYLYPPVTKNGVNPYTRNLKKSLAKFYKLRDAQNRISRIKSGPLLRYSFNTDVFILNWIESVGHLKFGVIQMLIAIIALQIIKIRRKKVIWIFHNIQPHEGETWKSIVMKRYMFNNANLIISHSKEATQYASKFAKCNVQYECHPIESVNYNCSLLGEGEKSDIIIWGWVTPYKGIPEFLENCAKRLQDMKIHIIGKCNDDQLANRIIKYTNDKIVFDNRKAEFSEIATLVRNSKYVVFPYIGDSISSSGVLIDTLVMGGTPVGPNRAAFKDLNEDQVCLVYDNYEELVSILLSDLKIDSHKRARFMKDNSWEKFAYKIYKFLNE